MAGARTTEWVSDNDHLLYGHWVLREGTRPIQVFALSFSLLAAISGSYQMLKSAQPSPARVAQWLNVKL